MRAHDSKVVELCGSKVRLWKPTGAVSDTTLKELDPQGTFLAMVKDLKGLTHMKAGRIIKAKEAFLGTFSDLDWSGNKQH